MVGQIDRRLQHRHPMPEVLPAGTTWYWHSVNETFDLYDGGYRLLVNPTYWQSAGDVDRQSASEEARGAVLLSFEDFEVSAELSAFGILREAVVRAVRAEGMRHGQYHRGHGWASFADAARRGREVADHAVTTLLGRVGQSPAAPAELHGVIEQLRFRFDNAYQAAYIFHAYGVGRGPWAAEELARWPHQHVTPALSMDARAELAGLRRSAPRAVETLALAHPVHLAGYENVTKAIIGSFIQDSLPTFAARREPTLLPVDRQHETVPELTSILRALSRMAWFVDHPGSPQALGRYDSLYEQYTAAFTAAFTRHLRDLPPLVDRPRPEPQPYGVSPRGAELLCCEWMQFLGVADAAVTSFSQDGGIDVVSEKYVAQVKHYVGSVGGPEVQQLVGAAYTLGKRPVFFTSGTYTAAAVEAAMRARVPLLQYSAEAGTITAANDLADKILRDGFA